MEISDEALQAIIQWASEQPQVRAAILTSTRAIPGTQVDPFSDYDVILILTDVLLFHEDANWLADFGPVLAGYHDPLGSQDGFPVSAYVVQYESGLKIDFSLWPTGLLQKIAAEPALPPELDAGYQVLIDKDRLTEHMKPPTYRAYIPTPPDETVYQQQVEQCFLVAIYVAKYLWRGDLMAARYVLETYLKDEHLRPILEWHMEIDHHWTIKPGPYGRGLQKWLRRDLWTELEKTYAGPGLEENWQSLFQTIALMRKAAKEVADRLGFSYPEDKEQRTLDYIKKIKNQPASFS